VSVRYIRCRSYLRCITLTPTLPHPTPPHPPAAEHSALSANAPMVLSAWKGKCTLAIMADKSETGQMIDRLEAAKKRVAAVAQVAAAP